MKQVSNSDYDKILRLLYALSKTQGKCVREKENARKAAILHKKLLRKDERGNNSTELRTAERELPVPGAVPTLFR